MLYSRKATSDLEIQITTGTYKKFQATFAQLMLVATPNKIGFISLAALLCDIFDR